MFLRYSSFEKLAINVERYVPRGFMVLILLHINVRVQKFVRIRIYFGWKLLEMTPNFYIKISSTN